MEIPSSHKRRYKLVALDMDGTVLNRAGEIGELTRQWLLKAMRSGIMIVFATGRGMVRIRPHMDLLGMSGPVITTNGSEVWKSPGQLHCRRLLEAEAVVELRQLAMRENLHYWAYTSEGLLKPANWISDGLVAQTEWLKFAFFTRDEDQTRRMRQQFAAWDNIEITSSLPNQIEINAKGVNKGAGVREVCKLFGIDMSEVVAMGDGENDVAMITGAGLGVAMGNAPDEVKRHADIVAATNEDHGVAQIIRDYVL